MKVTTTENKAREKMPEAKRIGITRRRGKKIAIRKSRNRSVIAIIQLKVIVIAYAKIAIKVALVIIIIIANIVKMIRDNQIIILK